MKTIKLLFIAFILGNTTILAQNSDLQKFIGVWNCSRNGIFGNIKVIAYDNNLNIKIKTNKGIMQADNISVNGNTLYFSFVDETNYGRWYIGSNNQIIVDYGNGTAGNNGEASQIYYRGKADTEVERWCFKAVLNGDVLDLYNRAEGTYYGRDSYGRYGIIFSQYSNYVLYDSYSNW